MFVSKKMEILQENSKIMDMYSFSLNNMRNSLKLVYNHIIVYNYI